jgi:uncharacterized protein (TIGR00297 family)
VLIDSPHDRLILGAAATAAVAIIAYLARTLTKSGGFAAFLAGTIAIAAGWSWGILLLALFIGASALSRYGEKRKTALVEKVVEKGGRRDAMQVAANGAVFIAAAAGHFLFGGEHWFALGIGALSASTADTWSTEIGTLGGSVPRLIVSGKEVPPGTSGGLTAAGTLGAVAGALFAAAGAALAGWPVPIAAVVAGGLAGAFGDSLLGATVQSKRWCDRCGVSTERTTHDCGATTKHVAGLAWLDNDGVNFISTVIGGLVAMLFAGIGSGN